MKMLGVLLSCIWLGGVGCKRSAPPLDRSALPAHPFRVGVVFDVGGIDDKSFNESVYRGVMRAKERFGFELKYYQSNQPADRKNSVRLLASKGFDVIIGNGFVFTDELLEISRDFPKSQFVCMEMNVTPANQIPPNLLGIQFRSEEGGFLAGALAALATHSKKLGFVGGMKVPVVQELEAGYKAGIKYIDPGIEVVTNYAGETPQAFEDPEVGKNRAMEQFKSGVDIIFQAAGKTGLGVFRAALAENKLVIGMDSDQYREAPLHVLSSLLKSLDVAIFDVLQQAIQGHFEAGRKTFGLKENGLSLVWDEHNRTLMSPMIHNKVMAIREDIIAGKIQMPKF